MLMLMSKCEPALMTISDNNEGPSICVLFQLGEISEIRLVKSQMGKSKGFAYIEFKNQVRNDVIKWKEMIL